MARSYPEGKPRLYAAEKLPLLRKRQLDAEIGPATERMAAIAFPGAPSEVFHGFTAFSTGPLENTTDSTKNKFHEIGLYQVEAGPRSGPAPNSNPKLEYSNWARLAASELVMAMLGRAATVEEGAWKKAIDDQIAVGLANLRDHSRNMADGLARRLKKHGFTEADAQALSKKVVPREPGSNWAVMWAFTSFSRGEGQFTSTLAAYLRELAEDTEATRWVKWRQLVNADIRAKKAGIGSKKGKKGAAYALVRTEQKFQSGFLLAQNTGGNAAWFQCAYTESAEDLDMEDRITRRAYP